MSTSPDRLYELLPVVYRQRDAEQGRPLRALLRVIAEQVDVVEEDISQLYENWFIETCQDWIVPYIGDLIGYRPVHEAGEPGDVDTPQGQQRNKILIPRREVANTIRYRRRKGTLALLELLANDVAGWPARAVEFYKLLGLAQAINHLQLTRSRTVDLREGVVLDRLDGPFDELAHTVDVRRIISHRTRGRYNIPTVGLFVWRLKAYSVTKTPAYCREDVGAHFYTFSVLGNDSPLYTRPESEPDPTHIAGELNLPIPIRRRAFEARKTDYYGAGKSLEIWVEGWVEGFSSRRLVPPERIVPANLTGWHYRPLPGRVAVDPVLGRIAFHPRHLPQRGVWVSYYYGFSADVGGGEYDRPLSQPTERLLFDEDDFKDLAGLARKLRRPQDLVSQYLWDQFSAETRQLLENYGDSDTVPETLQKALIDELNRLLEDESLYDPERFEEIPADLRRLIEQEPQGRALMHLNRLLLERTYQDEIAKSFVLYRVGRRQELKHISGALRRWREERPRHAIVEITDSGVYVEQINVSLHRNQTLQLRAANGTRPVVRLLDWHTDLPDALTVSGRRGSRFTLDGLLVTGRAIQIEGELAGVAIRHSTLVPGWALHHDCEPRRPAEPSLILFNTPRAGINIEHSIIGSIQFNQDEVREDPVRILISDSILDATSPEREALGAPGWPAAHARLTIARSTVFGQVQVHAIDLAENTIFDGLIKVARRQWGCMRFCYVTPHSRTPRRYNCQPDLVEQVVKGDPEMAAATDTEKEAALRRERLRVRPQFNSVRYGTPTYCQLAEACAEEIKRGADDESEIGVFHDLFQPQREANLRARLNEYTPAGMDAGIIFAS
jgi:hypothetical protein